MANRLINEIDQSVMSVAEVIRKLDSGEMTTLTDGEDDTDETAALHRSLLEILKTVRRRLAEIDEQMIE